MAEEKKNNVPAKAEHTAVKKVENPQKLGLFKRIKKWFREMKSELKKVVWPTAKQITNNSLVVLVVIFVSAVVLWGFDKLATGFVQVLSALFG